jgi:hypothetical protein
MKAFIVVLATCSVAMVGVSSVGPSEAATSKKVATRKKPQKPTATATTNVSVIAPTTLTGVSTTVPSTAPVVWPLKLGQTAVVAGPGDLSALGKALLLNAYTGQQIVDLSTGATKSLLDELPLELRSPPPTNATINGDGSLVAFQTTAGGVGDGQTRSLVFTRRTGSVKDVGPVGVPQISGDGTMVFYAAGPVRLGGPPILQRYLVNIDTLQRENVVVGPDGSSPLQKTYWTYPSFSGRVVMFYNMFPGTKATVFLRDLDTQTTTEAGWGHTPVALSGNGKSALVSQPYPADIRMTALQIVDPPPPLWKPFAQGVDGAVNSRFGAISFDGNGVVYTLADTPAGPPVREGQQFQGVEVFSKKIFHVDRRRYVKTEIVLQKTVTGEIANITKLVASDDLLTLHVCAEVFASPAISETTTSTTSTQRLIEGRPVENKCFVHRRYA